MLKEYITQSQPEMNKNLNFPKKHMITHIFDNILAKGVTHNYNTKPNEKMHGALWKFYLQHTNFKNVAPQVHHIAVYNTNILLTSYRSWTMIIGF